LANFKELGKSGMVPNKLFELLGDFLVVAAVISGG